MAPLLAWAGIIVGTAFAIRLRDPAGFDEKIRPLLNWRTAVVFWLALIAVSFLATFGYGLVLAALLFVAFWINEVRLLLGASDDAFPGRNDKMLWGMYLLFCPPVGAVLFRLFREKNWATAKAPATDWL